MPALENATPYHEDSIVTQIMQIVWEMDAAAQDIANRESIILDIEYSGMYLQIADWAKQIDTLRRKMLDAKNAGNVDTVIYNPIAPVI